MNEAHTRGAIDVKIDDGELGFDIRLLLRSCFVKIIRPDFQQVAQYRAVFDFGCNLSADIDRAIEEVPKRGAAGFAAT